MEMLQVLGQLFGYMALCGCVALFATYITAWIVPIFLISVVAWIFWP